MHHVNVCHATVGHFCPEMHVNTMKSPLKSMPKEPVSNTMVSAIQLMKFLLNFGWKNYFNVNDLRRFAMLLKQQ